MVYAILAMSKNGVIGEANDLPWHLSADLKHFQAITTGNTVIMGRKTWQAIHARLGKGLPNRTNVVITRDPDFQTEGAVVVHSIEEAIKQSEDVYIIGGSQIFEYALKYIDTLYLTEVEAIIEGDTHLESFDRSDWIEISRESHPADDKNDYPYTFLTYERANKNR